MQSYFYRTNTACLFPSIYCLYSLPPSVTLDNISKKSSRNRNLQMHLSAFVHQSRVSDAARWQKKKSIKKCLTHILMVYASFQHGMRNNPMKASKPGLFWIFQCLNSIWCWRGTYADWFVCLCAGSTMSLCLEFLWRTSPRQSDWSMETPSWPTLWFLLLSQTRYLHTRTRFRCGTAQ